MPVTPGRFMLRLRLPNGVINADQLDVLADAVDRCGSHGSADITTRQNIQLRGLLLEDMPPLLAALERVGLMDRIPADSSAWQQLDAVVAIPWDGSGDKPLT